MKRVLIGALATFLVAAPLAFVSADNATTSTSTKGRFGERWQDKKEQIQEKKNEMKDRWAQNRAERILNILTRVEERFQRAVDRMTNIADRVQSRIDLLEDGGANLDDAQNKLDDAKDKIDDAQNALDDIDFEDSISTSTGSTSTPAMIFKGLRDEFGAVKNILKEAHGLIVDSIVSIKGQDDENN
jgi:chromosome segregation ATPase